MSGTQRELHRQSLDDPEGFWLDRAAAIDWEVPPGQVVLDRSRAPFYRWFPGARLNTCYNAVDRHADRAPDVPALVFHSAVTGARRTYTYSELRNEVARAAGALRQCGVNQGDRVVIYMPMIPEAVVAMLACARLGAVHSVVFGGFAPRELAKRIDHCGATVVVSASCGLEGNQVIEYKPLLDRALDLCADPPTRCIIVQRPQVTAGLVAGRDLAWDTAMAGAEPVPCVTVDATDPLYILYTSGTTGRPKGVVRDNGGHAVALAWSMAAVFNTGPGEVFWAASDVGWVVGHSYIVYAPLLVGATTVLYEGKPVGTPDAGAFWRVVSEHKVKTMFTAPTAIRAIRKLDPTASLAASYEQGSLRALFLAGERLDSDTWQWASDTLGVPVVDNWWQTETGWPIAANCLGLGPSPMKPGSPSLPVPGYDVRILDPDGRPCPPGVEGSVVIRTPLPPGTLSTLYNDDERYLRSYFAAFDDHYLTGDGGLIDDDGYLFVMGRMDDLINVAGHRLSTGAMEEVISTHPAVAECAVVGMADPLKGQVPLALVVCKLGDVQEPAALEAEVVALVRDLIGAVAALRTVVIVDRLPKTRSGKILRRSIRGIADGLDEPTPPTIDDPAILTELRSALAVLGGVTSSTDMTSLGDLS